MAGKQQAKRDFLIFWAKYYQKKGKSEAERWWLKYRPDFVEVLAALELQKQEKDWLESKKKFVAEWPYGSTYIHQKRWEDGYCIEFQKYLEAEKIKKEKAQQRKERMRLLFSQRIKDADKDTLKQAYEHNYLETGHREGITNIRWLIRELRPEAVSQTKQTSRKPN